MVLKSFVTLGTGCLCNKTVYSHNCYCVWVFQRTYHCQSRPPFIIFVIKVGAHPSVVSIEAAPNEWAHGLVWNLRLGCKWLTVTTPLAYSTTESIMVVKVLYWYLCSVSFLVLLTTLRSKLDYLSQILVLKHCKLECYSEAGVLL